MKSFLQYISEEGEAPVTTTDGVEPKKEPAIRRKYKDNAKKWVKLGPISRWGYSNYGISPDANISGDQSYGAGDGGSE